MSHHFKNFQQRYYDEDDPDRDRLRFFIRKHRKVILILFAVAVLVVIALVALAMYLGFQLIDKTPQIISGSSEIIAQNQGKISQFVQWVLGIVRQLGFMFGG